LDEDGARVSVRRSQRQAGRGAAGAGADGTRDERLAPERAGMLLAGPNRDAALRAVAWRQRGDSRAGDDPLQMAGQNPVNLILRPADLERLKELAPAGTKAFCSGSAEPLAVP